MSTLNNGDVVRLKSGSPKMTVGKQTGSDLYSCYWFNKDEEVKSANFSSSMLEKE